MSNHSWETIKEKDFEKMLESSISKLPPDNIAAAVTPWKKPMYRILAGLALNAFILDFLWLEYVLPAIGTTLLLLGFCNLRRENKWFKICFILSVFQTIYFYTFLILNTSIYRTVIYNTQAVFILKLFHLAILFFELVCLWRGVLSVQQKAGISPHGRGAAALIVWYALLCLLALIQYSGWIVPGAMIVSYIFIIRSLCKLSKEFDEAGYVIRPAYKKVSDRSIVILLLSILLAGSACGYTFGGSYPMEWTVLKADEAAKAADTKSGLLQLGFPEYVLNDISVEDLAACEGARQVVVNVADEPADDIRNLRITGVGVQISGEKEQWIIFHHFLWKKDFGCSGTEAIQLLPAYHVVSDGWESAGDVTGRVLYDKNGETFVSDYYFLGSQTDVSNNIQGEDQNSTQVFAAFSMPYGSRQQRGYVSYTVNEIQEGYTVSSWFNYIHQRNWFQYPAVTAMEKRMHEELSSIGAFRLIQDEFLFDPVDGNVELDN